MSDGPSTSELQRIYATRFSGKSAYRTQVWRELAAYFAKWVPPQGTVLDLGAGYCEFINNVTAHVKYAMDLNPSLQGQAAPGVTVLQQDSTQPWPLEKGALDAVFTSNFLEHLPDKTAVGTVLSHAHRCLRPGGHFIAVGPNIRYVPGAYWDFFDHYVPLTDLSLSEALTSRDFTIVRRVARFLPYTMSDGIEYPIAALRLYLIIPFAWRLFGKQFLVVGRKAECGGSDRTRKSDPKLGPLHQTGAE